MKVNKYFNQIDRQKRIEDKIDRYYNAMKSDKIREVLDKMPKNQKTLDVIENQLSEYIKDIEGDNPQEKWGNLVTGIKAVENVVKKNKKKEELSIDKKEEMK